MTKQTRELVRKIEDAADELADELAKYPDGSRRFRQLARNLKKLVLELSERIDG